MSSPALEVADWRRRVFALYARVRAEPDAAMAHRAWRAERDELQAKLDRIGEAVDGMTGLPSVSKLAAFLETIKEIIKPKEG